MYIDCSGKTGGKIHTGKAGINEGGKRIFGRNFIPPMLPLIWKEISMN